MPSRGLRVPWLALRLSWAGSLNCLYEETVEGAMSLAHADFGTLQLVDPVDGSLRIMAHSGFGSEFTEHFARVEAPAGGDLRVNEDEGFAAHRVVAAAAGVRSVQSTPLVEPDGSVIGILSTHGRHTPVRRVGSGCACRG